MKFILLYSFDNYVAAHIAMGRLKEEYINCYLQDEYSVTIDPFLSNAIGGIKLMVAEPQLERAKEINTAEPRFVGDNWIKRTGTSGFQLLWFSAILSFFVICLFFRNLSIPVIHV